MPICDAWGCGLCGRLIVDCLCLPATERFRVSRMREIRKSGLTRAEEARNTVPPLLDWRSLVPVGPSLVIV